MILKRDLNSWYATWQSSTVCLECVWSYRFVGTVFGESKGRTFDTIKLTSTVQTVHLMKTSF